MITIIITLITVITSLIAFSNREFLIKMMFIPYNIKRNNEWYRFLSNGFIHADFMHLAFNMIALYSFGSYLESAFSNEFIFGSNGKIVYIVLYFSALIISGTISYIKHKDNPQYLSVGASGAVSAVIFSSIIINPFLTLTIFPIPLPIPGYIFGPLYLLYTYYMSKKNMDNIGHDAHLLGAVWGIVFTLITWHQAIPNLIQMIQNR